MIGFDDLRHLPVFDGVSDDALGRVASRAADVRIDEGQWLVREGDAASFYVLLAGTFDVMKLYPDGARRLATRVPGDFIGELALVLGTPFFAGAWARTPLRAARFDRAEFGILIADSSALRDRVVAAIQERVEGFETEAASTLRVPVVIGRTHDPSCYGLRDFLARNQVRFEWADPGDARLATRPDLDAALAAAVDCVVVCLPDRRFLVDPSTSELAVEVGLQVEPEHHRYDLVIVGGGPTGLAAAVYGASEGLRTLLVEREATGGQAGTSTRIENYLGFPSGVSGDDLAARAREQALRLGAEIVVTRSVESISPLERCHVVRLDHGVSLCARSVILATGVSYRALGAEGIDAFAGIGVFYGAARSEAAAMQGRDVVLVGGGNSAGQAAVYFADYASSVTIAIRGAGLESSMSAYLIDEIAHKPNISVRPGTEITRCMGDYRLERVTMRNRADGSLEEAAVHALFIFIGADADTGWLPEEVVRDARGFICTGRDVTDLAPAAWPLERDPYLLETSVPGIFAAGDVRHGSVKRVASGVGEGSTAIALVHEHLSAGLAPAAVRSLGRPAPA